MDVNATMLDHLTHGVHDERCYHLLNLLIKKRVLDKGPGHRVFFVGRLFLLR